MRLSGAGFGQLLTLQTASLFIKHEPCQKFLILQVIEK